jgi:hypothetical protein
MRAAADVADRIDRFKWSDFLLGLTVLTGGVAAGALALRFLFL